MVFEHHVSVVIAMNEARSSCSSIASAMASTINFGWGVMVFARAFRSPTLFFAMFQRQELRFAEKPIDDTRFDLSTMMIGMVKNDDIVVRYVR